MIEGRARMTVNELLSIARSRLQRLDPVSARDAVAAGAALIDIRSERQRERDGVIPDAIFMPRNVLEWRLDPASGHADPALCRDISRHVILFCDEGYQSSLAAATLQQLGFHRATDVDRGFPGLAGRRSSGDCPSSLATVSDRSRRLLPGEVSAHGGYQSVYQFERN
jgi:rhodanese-related sulfurtransferase